MKASEILRVAEPDECMQRPKDASCMEIFHKTMDGQAKS